MSFKAALTAAACAAALALAGQAQAQTAAPAPAPAPAPASANAPAPAAAASSSAAKQALVARVLQLQQAGIENMARGMVEQPALQVIQQARGAIQRVPAERRDAVAREIEGDVRKFVEDTAPPVSARAVALAPSTIGALLDDRFTEDELRQVVALLESPVNRKFQEMAPDMQRAISEKLVAETRAQVEANAGAMERSINQRLVAAAPAPAPAPAASAPARAPRAPASPASAPRR